MVVVMKTSEYGVNNRFIFLQEGQIDVDDVMNLGDFEYFEQKLQIMLVVDEYISPLYDDVYVGQYVLQ